MFGLSLGRLGLVGRGTTTPAAPSADLTEDGGATLLTADDGTTTLTED